MGRNTKMKLYRLLTAAVMAALCTAAYALPPPDIEAKLVALGRVVDAPGTTAIYGPILINQSHAGVEAKRDIAYGTDPRALLDVSVSTTPSKTLKPVLIYVPGGGGNKKLDYPGGEPFYDNIMIVAWRGQEDRLRPLRSRADERRGPAVHPLYLRLDR